MKKGFTLIEIILVLSIFSILASFTTINLLRPQNIASVESISTQLTADIKNQQIKSIVGDTEGQSDSQQFGIYFENDGYSLFRGSSYNLSEPSNFKIQLTPDLALTNIALPSNQIVFEKQSGDVSNFTEGTNSLVITHTTSAISKTITINRYGAITVN